MTALAWVCVICGTPAVALSVSVGRDIFRERRRLRELKAAADKAHAREILAVVRGDEIRNPQSAIRNELVSRRSEGAAGSPGGAVVKGGAPAVSSGSSAPAGLCDAIGEGHGAGSADLGAVLSPASQRGTEGGEG